MSSLEDSITLQLTETAHHSSARYLHDTFIPIVRTHYLTHTVDTHVVAVQGTPRAITDFVGKRKEEVVALSNTVELAHLMIWAKRANTHSAHTVLHIQ